MDGAEFDALTEKIGRYATCPECGEQGFISDMSIEPGQTVIGVRVEHSRPRQSTTWPQATKIVHTGKMPFPTD
jgi:hypothetical protein